MSGFASGVVTVLALLAFLAVVVWAYSAKRKVEFDKMARLPLEDAQSPDAIDDQIERKP